MKQSSNPCERTLMSKGKTAINGCRKMWTSERDRNIYAAVRVFSDAGLMKTGLAEWNATKDKCLGLQDLCVDSLTTVSAIRLFFAFTLNDSKSSTEVNISTTGKQDWTSSRGVFNNQEVFSGLETKGSVSVCVLWVYTLCVNTFHAGVHYCWICFKARSLHKSLWRWRTQSPRD